MAHGPDTPELMHRIRDATDTLVVSWLDITSLPELPDTILYLDCSYTQLSVLTSLPPNLVYLNCSHTMIHNLPPLPHSLMELNCSNTFIWELFNLPPFLMSLECVNTCLIQRCTFEYMSDYVSRFRENSQEHFKTLLYLGQYC